MIIPLVTLSALLLAGYADDDHASRAKLMGTWEQSDGNGEAKSTWTLEGRSGSIHMTNSNGAQKVVEFKCGTMGKECAIKDAGHSSKVSLWYSGPKLVELERRGSQIVKRRFGIAGDGDTMEIETIPVVPEGKSEITHYKRVASAVAKQ